jgi:hypothetical protein
LQQQGEEVDLEQEIPDLVEQLRVVTRLRRVGDLIRLLNGVWDDRARRLLAVPGALAPQPFGQLLQLSERFRERQSSAFNRWWWRSSSSTRTDPATG